MSETNFLNYKGFPVVRSGNVIHVGSMGDKCVVMLRSMGKSDDMSGEILVQLLSTDPTVPPNEMVLKKANKVGLYNAIDLACAWLETELR